LAAAACRTQTAPAPPASKTLTVAVRGPSSLDPARLRDSASILVARQLYEPLLAFDPKTLALVPRLAKSWDVLDGGARFVFHLRPGAYFHDGKQVTAADVVFSLNRLVRKDVASDLAYLMDSVIGYQNVVTGFASDLEGLRALDDQTVEVRLSAPWFDFPYVLTNPATSPVPRADLEADPAAFAVHPIGAGPFQLTGQLARNRDFDLDRFPGYWRTLAASAPQRVHFAVYDKVAAAWGDLESGKVDVAEVDPSRIEEARAKYGDRGFAGLAAGLYLGINSASPKLADLKTRQAISLAIDRSAIGRSIYGGTLEPASEIIPPAMSPALGAAAAKRESAPPCGGFCSLDVKRASPPASAAVSFVYEFPSRIPNPVVGDELKHDLEAAGMGLQLHPVDDATFVDDLNAGRQELFRLGWVADYPSLDWFLTPLFKSHAPDNHQGYSAPDVDAALAGARAEPDPVRRASLYAGLESRVLGDMVVVPVGFFKSHYAARSRVGGFYVDATGSFEASAFSLGAG
jgi:peptide/nickel transport system substrate-binding protein/oligopeptide transport system substrate-binding protein